MAEIKIKEGSCFVFHAGKPQEATNDTGHVSGTAIRIKFMDSGKKYTFIDGVLQPPGEVQESIESLPEELL